VTRHWRVLREADAVTLAGRVPVQFDIRVEAHFPAVDPIVLAHEIRKDIWRKLRSLRGFSPVVRVRRAGEGLCVEAGGQVSAASWPRESATALVEEVLECPARRLRWTQHARRK